ncbi:MAG TPA: translocation/assembly module TamB domain-containing protein [Kofleriaceae bacterium]|jgi:autotransporter translocation and assembly factor TamB
MPRKIWRWSWRIVVILLGLVVLAVGGVLIFVNTDSGRRVLRDQVNAQLEKTFVGGGHVGSIDGSPFGTLIAHDIVINDPTGKPFVTAKKAEIELNLIPLIGQRAQLKRVSLTDVDVQVARDKDGSFLASKLLVPNDKKSGWNIELAKVEVVNAHVAIEVKPINATDAWVNFDNLAITARAHLPANGPIDATLGLTGSWRERAVPVQVQGTVHEDGREGTSIPQLIALVGGVSVTAGNVRIVPLEPQPDRPSTLPRISGIITVVAPAKAVKQLNPDIELPDDVTATITAKDANPWTQVAAIGSLGKQPIQVYGAADFDTMRASGAVMADGVDITRWSQGKVTGTGGSVVTFDAALGRENEKPVATGIALAWGDVMNLPHAMVAATFHTDGTRARTLAGVAGGVNDRGDLMNAAIAADLTFGDVITLDRSTLVATSTNPAAASGGRAPVHGALDAKLTASGRLSPNPDLAVKGTANGSRLRVQDMSAKSLKLAIDAKGLPSKPTGKAEIDIESLVRGDMKLGKLEVTAGSQPDNSIDVSIRSRPEFAPWVIDVDARVMPPKPRTDTWVVDIVKHRFKAGSAGDWTGTTGHLELSPDRFAIESFQTTSQQGSLSLTASVAAHHLDVDADVARPDVGKAHMTVDINAPAQFTNPVAWMRLNRSAIRSGTVTLAGDLAKGAELLGQKGQFAGRVTGRIQLSPTETTGALALQGISTPALNGAGPLDAALNISQSAPDEITALLAGQLTGIGPVQAKVQLGTPKDLFSPLAWKALGPNAMRGAQLVVSDVQIEPGLLDKFGIMSDLRATLNVAANIGPGMRGATATVDLRQLRGDAIAQPIDAHIETAIDTKTTMGVIITSGKVTLLDAKGELPLSIDQVFENPLLLTTTPFQVKATIPDAPAKNLLAVFGRTEVLSGTLGGTITVDGTLGAPNVKATLAVQKLQPPPAVNRRPVKMLETLALDATYTNGVAKATITGKEPNGSLEIVATASPRDLAHGTATIKATAFDLEPLLLFAPGAAGAGRGTLDANLAVSGFDPTLAKVIGDLHLKNARVPIAPQIGTLRKANIDITVDEKAMKITAEGKLGGKESQVKVVGTVAMQGALPTGGEAQLTIRQVRLIGVVEPIIDADVSAKIHRDGYRWIADLQVKKGNVKVPDERSAPLKPIGPPPDMVYAQTGQKMERKHLEKRQPQQAMIVVNVDLGRTNVESTEVRGVIKGKVAISADTEAVGIVGLIQAERGDLDLFGRRYQVEKADVRFDGSTDPLLDIAIVYDFPDVSTTTVVRGRLSKPQLQMSSDPSIYSQDQLLGFLLGGEPNGDPAAGSASSVAASAGGSFIANAIGGYVKKALPIDIDVLRYSAATATESAAVTVGTWLTRSLFLAYRVHPGARPDENTNEANAQYWLSHRVSLEATTGDRAVSGIDLLWRKRY